MTQKLQINSLEALERLIGGDTALELEIRNNVANDFAKKHLKVQYDAALHAEARDLATKLKADSAAAIKDAVKLYFKETNDTWGWNKVLVINDECKEQIKARVRAELGTLVREYVQEKVAEIKTEVSVRVKEHLDYEVALQIKKGVQDKIDQLKKSI